MLGRGLREVDALPRGERGSWEEGSNLSGFGFRVSGFGFRVSGSESEFADALGFRVSGLGFRVWILARHMRVQCSVLTP